MPPVFLDSEALQEFKGDVSASPLFFLVSLFYFIGVLRNVMF